MLLSTVLKSTPDLRSNYSTTEIRTPCYLRMVLEAEMEMVMSRQVGNSSWAAWLCFASAAAVKEWNGADLKQPCSAAAHYF